MIKLIKIRPSILAIIISLLAVSHTFAANNVVVVPLLGEDVAAVNSCARGQIRAYAQVQGIGLSASFVEVSGYNCTGGTVMARRANTGTYELRVEDFVFDATTNAMVIHVTAVGGSGGTITGYGTTASNDLRINTYDNGGSASDKLFSVTVIDPGFVSP